MKKPSDQPDSGYGIGDLLGLGSQSVRKNYYPALQDRIYELEQERNRYKWLFENAFMASFRPISGVAFSLVIPPWPASVGTTVPSI